MAVSIYWLFVAVCPLHLSTGVVSETTESTQLVEASVNISTMKYWLLRARLLAANGIEITWTLNDSELDNDLEPGGQDPELQHEYGSAVRVGSNLTSVRVVRNGTACDDVTQTVKDCFVQFPTTPNHCYVWDIESRRDSFIICVGTPSTRSDLRSADNATHLQSTSSGTKWLKTGVLHSGFLEPPLIEKCEIFLLRRQKNFSMDNPFKPFSVDYVEKDSLKLSCRVMGLPSPRLSWCHNYQRCYSTNGSLYDGVTVDNRDGTLLIDRATSLHHGVYVLHAQNEFGHITTAGIQLQFAELLPFPRDGMERKYKIPVGRGAKLDCHYPHSSSPSLHYDWSKVTSARDQNPQHVTYSDRIILGLDGSLIFVNTLTQDSAFYVCSVTNAVLDKTVHSNPIELEVTSYGILEGSESPVFNSLPSSLSRSSSSSTALTGSSHTMQCAFIGRPTPHITWITHSSDVPSVPSSRHVLSVGNHSLTITAVELADQRDYSCTAENTEGATQPVKFSLLVGEVPKITEFPRSVNAVIGDTVKFVCRASGNPQPVVSWIVNGLQVSERFLPQYEFLSSEQFVLRNVSRTDSAVVQCNASNIHGYVLASSTIQVYTPTKILRGPSDATLIPHSVVRFHCDVSSDPLTIVNVSWLRGNSPIALDGHRIFVDPADRSLVLNLTTEEDGGRSFVATYTCVATDGISAESRPARLRPPVVVMVTDVIDNNKTSDGIWHSTLWPTFSSSTDVVWLSVFCGILSLVVIVAVATRLAQRQHCTDAVGDKSVAAGTASELIPLHHLTRSTCSQSAAGENGRPSSNSFGLTCESRPGVDLLSVKDPRVQDALQFMFIPRSRLRLGNTIGRGQFGRVFCALLSHSGKNEDEKVAVKTMKYKADETDMANLFLHEAILMKDFHHMHVLGVIGISFDLDSSPMVILPYMANGDLRQYIMNTELDITVLRLLKMALQVSYGMEYLSRMRFVHRDLAARNCMVDDHGIVKVADFGLSRELIVQDYYRLSHNKTPVPVRWMAPESLDSNVFTTMSDVWSFGVLMWELVTRGAVPYADVENWDVANYVKTGKRLLQPLYCPDSVYDIMLRCWIDNAEDRPTFVIISADIERIIGSAQALPATADTASSSATWQPVTYANTDASELALLPEYRNTVAGACADDVDSDDDDDDIW